MIIVIMMVMTWQQKQQQRQQQWRTSNMLALSELKRRWGTMTEQIWASQYGPHDLHHPHLSPSESEVKEKHPIQLRHIALPLTVPKEVYTRKQTPKNML